MRARGEVATALAAAAVLALAPAVARAERAFAPRFTQNAQGDIAIAANTALSCIVVEPTCPAARAGTGPASTLNNNANVMTYVDVDADAATFDSSSADLDLPEGARVLFAALYWGARTRAGTGGAPAPDPAARGRVLLHAPGDDAYRPISADQVDEAGEIYQGAADVTGLVRDAGPGAYTVADLQAGTGRNDAELAGWSLVVAYGDAAQPPRNLAVFDGLRNVGTGLGAPVTVALSGFRTPTTGVVRSKVGLVAYEGDLGTTGDGATLQGAAGDVGLPQGSPSSNLFRSAILTNGADAGGRVPAYADQLGFDAQTFATTNLLGNGQTATTVRLSTRGDAYQPGVVTLATDLFAPRIDATKVVDKTTAAPGDELTYTTTIRNAGEDAATDVTFDDALPDGVVPVAGSLTVDGATQPDPTGGPLALGTLTPGAVRVVAFRVRIAGDGLRSGTVLENSAVIASTAQDLGTRDEVTTAPARTALRIPDLAIAKAHSPAFVAGGASTYVIDVRNDGDGPTSGTVTVRDTLDPDLLVTGAAGGTGWTCTGTPDLTCTRADALAPGAAYPPIRVPVRVRAGVPPSTLSNIASVAATPDGDPGDDRATDAGAVSVPQVDLALTKTTTSTPQSDPSRYAPGEEVAFALTVTNAGPDDAPSAVLTDRLPASLLDAVAETPAGSCDAADPRAIRCDLGPLAAGASVTVTVRARLATTLPPYAPASTEINTATVAAPGADDLDAANDDATSSFETIPVTDLAVTKTFAPERPAAGGRVTYTVVVRNDGPAVADVALVDLVPDGLADVAVTIDGATGVCTIAPFPPQPGDLPQCAIPQLEVGGRRTVTITGRLAAGLAGAPVTNRAAVAGDAAEEDFANNLASVTFTPGQVDLGLTKVLDGPATARPGDLVAYRLTVRDRGDADDQDVVVTDPLPDGLTPAGPVPEGCALDGATVRCTVALLPAGAERSFTVGARVGAGAAGSTVVNAASVAGDAPDAAPADDVASAALAVGLPLPPAPAPVPTTPAPGTAPAPAPLAGAGAPVALSTSCASRRRFTIRLRERRGRIVVRARVELGGRRVAVLRRRDGRLTATIDLRGAPRSTQRVIIRATLRGGRALRCTRSYRTCAAKAPPSNHLDDPDAV